MAELYKTQAIILNSFAHGDKGHILYMYSRLHGRVSYYIYSTKRGIATIGGQKISLQQLTLLDIVAEIPSRGDFHRLKEAKNRHIANSIYGDIVKSTITLYIAEFLYRVIKDKEGEGMLFDFVVGSIKALGELNHKQCANFHLYFTVNIVKFLGFHPSNIYFEGSCFDMELCRFVTIPPIHGNFFNETLSATFNQFISIPLEEIDTIKLNRGERGQLLLGVINFLSIHHGTSYKIDSLTILSELF